MVAGFLSFPALLMQEFPAVIYKASFPSVFQQLKAQVFRIITVFLYTAVFGFYLYLLMAAVIGETPVPVFALRFPLPSYWYTKKYSFPCFGLQTADITVTVIIIGSLHPVAMVEPNDFIRATS